MLNALITGKTRLKLLLKFFLNSNTTSYLRDLETEFGDSTNAIRLELNRFENARLLLSSNLKNKKMYRANTAHPLFADIHNILRKTTGLDKLVDKVVHKLGGVQSAWLTGRFARGLDSDSIELHLVGLDLNQEYLDQLLLKVHSLIEREILCHSLPPENLPLLLQKHPEAFLLWEKDKNTALES